MEDKLDLILSNQAEFKKAQGDLQEEVTALTTRLVGNKKLKQNGLVDEVAKNSKTRKNVYKALGFIAGLLLAWEAIREFFS